MTDHLPHIIHIGFAKCASTYLQDWFDMHPQVSYRPGGIAGMYNIYDLVETVLDKPSPARCVVTSAEQISSPTDPALYGRIVPARAYRRRERIEALCARLAKMFPDARILMITRNHDDLRRSSLSQLVRVGRLEMLDDVAQLETRWNDPIEAEQRTGLLPYDYDHALEVYTRHFGGRVLALPYELLVDDEPEFIRRVAEFMGVEPIAPKLGKVNQGLTDGEIYFYPRIAAVLHRLAWTPLIGRVLQKFHTVMVNRGGWKPLVALMLRLGLPRDGKLLPVFFLRRKRIACPRLLEAEVYAPYRERYMPSPD